MSKCKDCEYFNKKYLECEHPDISLSKAALCWPDNEACEYFEQNWSEQE